MTRVGQTLYQILHEDDGKPTVEEWIVRTVRGDKATAIWKLAGITWGKRSKKHGDFGWLDPLPAWTRQTWRIEGTGPLGLRTTKKAAVAEALKNAEPDDFDTPEQFERYVAGLKRIRT